MWGRSDAGQLGIPPSMATLLSEDNRQSTERLLAGKTERYSSEEAATARSVESYSTTSAGIVRFPNRLRVFILPVILKEDDPLGGSSRAAVKMISNQSSSRVHTDHRALCRTVNRFLHQMKLTRLTQCLDLISCRFSTTHDTVIVTLTDSVLLTYSTSDYSDLFSLEICHPAEVRFTAVACGEGHSIGLGYTAGGKREEANDRFVTDRQYVLLSWGQCAYGQLGVDLELHPQYMLDLRFVSAQSAEEEVEGSQPANAKSSLDNPFTALFLDEGEGVSSRPTPCLIYTWMDGQLASVLKPIHGNDEVDDCPECSIVSVRSGGCSNIALLSTGEALVWGSNDFGLLGTLESRQVSEGESGAFRV